MENRQLKRLALDARFYRRSTAGVGRYTRSLIGELQKSASPYDYTVILTPADYLEWPKKTPANWRAKVLNIPHYSLAEQTKLLGYLNASRFDLVHFTMFNHPIAYRRPFVVTIHDLIMTLFPLRPLWHPRTWAYRYVIRHAAKAARQIIAPSQSTRRDIENLLGVSKDKVTVTYEGVEETFQPQDSPHRAAEIRRKFDLTKPFVLFLNAWRPHKGLPELVQAFLALKKDHDVQLLVGGNPNPAFPEVIAAVEAAKGQSPDILTPGFVSDEDLVSLYSLAEAYVLTTHYEGFGIPALEAISCGCPVIAAKSSSTPEVLGDAALYYPPGDVIALSQAIGKLLTDSRLHNQLSTKGLAQAQKFSWAKMARETLAVYGQVLGQA